MSQFSELPLSPDMLRNLDTLTFTQMTPIQAAALPAMLAGQDVIGQAQTGSGKTVAFGLSLLHRLEVERYRIQGLVLCPTRELAEQVAQSLRQLARMTHNIKVLPLCGGVSAGPQFGSLEHGAHIIVGTPGRVLFHLRKGSLSLKDLHTLILDEADRMLDMGFEDELNEILSQCPEERQTLLFSATYPEDILAMSARCQRDPIEVSVNAHEQHSDIVEALHCTTKSMDKKAMLEALLHHHQPASCLIFCNRKIDADQLATALQDKEYPALAIHGDLEQWERSEALLRFANGSCPLLIATDVAARGLDIEALPMVVNFDLPYDPEVYVHRIGRTGRAGQQGLAVSIITPRERGRLERVEEYLQREIPEAPAPEWDPLQTPSRPEMVTLCLDGGKKRKMRPGDILGALTKDAGLPGDQIGKINIFAHKTYVAVHREIAHQAFKQFKYGKVKGRQLRVRRLSHFSSTPPTTRRK